MARVVRVGPSDGKASATPVSPERRNTESEVAVLLEVGGVRIAVRRGCDAATLAAVFEAMSLRGGGR